VAVIGRDRAMTTATKAREREEERVAWNHDWVREQEQKHGLVEGALKWATWGANPHGGRSMCIVCQDCGKPLSPKFPIYEGGLCSSCSRVHQQVFEDNEERWNKEMQVVDRVTARFHAGEIRKEELSGILAYELGRLEVSSHD